MGEHGEEGAATAPPRRRRGDGGRRERLLEMATAEFAAKGLAGARVDAIARAARSNKQLVYYYFGSKLGLYTEVIGRVGPAAHDELFADSDDDGRTLAERVRRRARHAWGPTAQRWARLMGWEALERGDRDILREQERFEIWRHRKREIEAAQDRGEVDRRFDAELLALALLSVELMPRVLPQLTTVVTGLSNRDPEFLRRQEALLVELVEHLRPPRGGDGGPTTARTRRS